MNVPIDPPEVAVRGVRVVRFFAWLLAAGALAVSLTDAATGSVIFLYAREAELLNVAVR